MATGKVYECSDVSPKIFDIREILKIREKVGYPRSSISWFYRRENGVRLSIN